MHDRISRLEQAISACEAKGKPAKALEAQLRQLLRDQGRAAARAAKEAAMSLEVFQQYPSIHA